MIAPLKGGRVNLAGRVFADRFSCGKDWSQLFKIAGLLLSERMRIRPSMTADRSRSRLSGFSSTAFALLFRVEGQSNQIWFYEGKGIRA
ncbi:MAG: hypothetical protein LBD68_00140 [Zoogloeaceae bacterium]|jgi:hypothetical protein|nr:hypothetical protein [Zoogloeaceae bacterium]